MTDHNYYQWKEFKNVYLEDSYVLKIEELDTKLIFHMDLVLTENHPLYTSPRENEHYCFKKGFIIFSRLRSCNWLSRDTRPSIDANGEEDYGNIDVFEQTKEGYYLEGDWGEVIIKSDPPKPELDS